MIEPRPLASDSSGQTSSCLEMSLEGTGTLHSAPWFTGPCSLSVWGLSSAPVVSEVLSGFPEHHKAPPLLRVVAPPIPAAGVLAWRLAQVLPSKLPCVGSPLGSSYLQTFSLRPDFKLSHLSLLPRFCQFLNLVFLPIPTQGPANSLEPHRPGETPD